MLATLFCFLAVLNGMEFIRWLFFHGNFIQSNDINATLQFAQALLGRRFNVKRLLDNTGIPRTLPEHEAARDP